MWVCKGGYRCGYKKHVVTDKEGFVEVIKTTPANTADTKEFVQIVDAAQFPPNTEVFADKGYTPKANSTYLTENNLKDGIMKKARRGRGFTEEEIEYNRRISKIRNKIERTFGSIRRWFHGGKCRYKGEEKTHGQNILEAICYNIKRAPNQYLNNLSMEIAK